jgi:hypothetical protein
VKKLIEVWGAFGCDEGRVYTCRGISLFALEMLGHSEYKPIWRFCGFVSGARGVIFVNGMEG